MFAGCRSRVGEGQYCSTTAAISLPLQTAEAGARARADLHSDTGRKIPSNFTTFAHTTTTTISTTPGTRTTALTACCSSLPSPSSSSAAASTTSSSSSTTSRAFAPSLRDQSVGSPQPHEIQWNIATSQQPLPLPQSTTHPPVQGPAAGTAAADFPHLIDSTTSSGSCCSIFNNDSDSSGRASALSTTRSVARENREKKRRRNFTREHPLYRRSESPTTTITTGSSNRNSNGNSNTNSNSSSSCNSNSNGASIDGRPGSTSPKPGRSYSFEHFNNSKGKGVRSWQQAEEARGAAEEAHGDSVPLGCNIDTSVATAAISTPPSSPRPDGPPIMDESDTTMQAADGSIPTIADGAATTAGFPSDTTESVSKDVAPFLTKHIPEQYASAPPQEDSQQGNTRYCYRHRPDVKCRRQADELTMDSLQKQLEKLPQEEQQTITHIWNLFSAAPATHRTIMLQGILTQCCFPQLSFISAALRDLIRIDFLTALPPELSFKILCYLDTTSLCKAAQVSQRWRTLADDDVVWHKMCEQHIDRKCDKCGWGLPLLERKRLRASKRQIQLRATGMTAESVEQATSSASRLNIHGKRSAGGSADDERPGSPVKRSCHGDGIASGSSSASEFVQPTTKTTFPKRRPWKDVYSERYKVESNWRRGRCTTKIFKGHTNGIMCLQFDDNILATGSYDNTIKIWDLETGKELRTLSGHTLGVRCLQFDERMLISGSLDHSMRIWNYRTGDSLSILHGHSGGVISLHFDGDLMVSGSVDKTIKVWNFSEKTCITLRGHTDWVNSVKLHAPSRTVFSASDDMTVKIWDLDTMACVKTLTGHVGQVQQVLPIELAGFDASMFGGEDKAEEGEMGEDGAASGSTSSVVPPPPVSPLASPPTPYTLTTPTTQVTSHLLSPPHHSSSSASSSSSCFPSTSPTSPSSSTRTKAKKPREPMPHYILTAALDSTVKLWDLSSGRCVKTLFGHLEGIWALAADNLRVVSGAQDRMVKVWDVRTGRCERTVTGHSASVSCLALSDSRLVTGSEDCEARLYCFKSVIREGEGAVVELPDVAGGSAAQAAAGERAGGGAVAGHEHDHDHHHHHHDHVHDHMDH